MRGEKKMIEGTYTKNGETVELITNGIQEIIPEQRTIQCIPMVSKKKRPRRKIDSFSLPNALVLGVVTGMTSGLMIMELIDGNEVTRIWAGLSLVIGWFWLWQNYFRRR